MPEPAADHAAGNPLVSVVIAARDAAETLGPTLESACAQTHRPIEIVVVDDGSTKPEARALLDELAPEFEARGWQLLRNAENRYPGAARNRAAVIDGNVVQQFPDLAHVGAFISGERRSSREGGDGQQHNQS